MGVPNYVHIVSKRTLSIMNLYILSVYARIYPDTPMVAVFGTGWVNMNTEFARCAYQKLNLYQTDGNQ